MPIHQKFTSATAGDQIEKLNRFAVSVTLGASDVVELQKQMPSGTWHTVKEYTASEYDDYAILGAVLPVRFECTTFTNGPIVCETATSIPE